MCHVCKVIIFCCDRYLASSSEYTLQWTNYLLTHFDWYDNKHSMYAWWEFHVWFYNISCTFWCQFWVNQMTLIRCDSLGRHGSLGHTVTIFAANYNELPRFCRKEFRHEWWRKMSLGYAYLFRETNRGESQRLTNTISDEMKWYSEEQSGTISIQNEA